jgi:hypothetical protein
MDEPKAKLDKSAWIVTGSKSDALIRKDGDGVRITQDDDVIILSLDMARLILIPEFFS